MKKILIPILTLLLIQTSYAINWSCSWQENKENNMYLWNQVNELSNQDDVLDCYDWLDKMTVKTLDWNDKIKTVRSDRESTYFDLWDWNDIFEQNLGNWVLANLTINWGAWYDKFYISTDSNRAVINWDCSSSCEIYIKDDWNNPYRRFKNVNLKNIEEIVFNDKSIKFDDSNTGDEDNNSSNDDTENTDSSSNDINYDKINLSNYKYLIPAYWWSYDLNKKLENINNAIVIINPSNWDFSSRQDVFVDEINRTHKNNNIVIGYIYTLYWKRSLADVKQRINSRLKYYPNIEGFFFDEVSTSEDKLEHYKEIYNYVKSKNKNLIVVLNPWTTPDSWYFDIADNIVAYENPCKNFSNYLKPSWLNNYANYRISYLWYSCSSSDYEKLSSKYSNNIQYFTDDGSDWNPWDSLSKYLQTNNTETTYAPYNFSKFYSILDVSKLTYPDSHTKVVNYWNFTNYKSDFFYANKNWNLYFILDKKSWDWKIRNELRQWINWKDEGWRIDENKVYHLNAKVKLQKLEKALEYTFLQIHSEVHPLLRVVVEKEKNWKQNHIWAVVRKNTNNSWIRTSRYDLWIVDNYFHSFDIYVWNNNLTIKKDWKTYVNKDISYWPEIKNYFKAGIYDSKDSKWPWTVKIAFSELKYDFSSVDDNQNKSIVKFPNWSTWFWKLAEPLTNSEINLNYDIFDIDLFDNSKDIISKLKSKWKKVVCYISAWTWENWRDDADKFPKSVLWNTLDWRPSEKYLDIRNYDKFSDIMKNRFILAKNKWCDAVEVDNVDAYTNDSWFSITKQDTIRYFKFLANTAHNLWLWIALKNTPEIVNDVVNDSDLVVVESCFQYNECWAYEKFISKWKAVLWVEYKLEKEQFCSKANDMWFSFAKAKTSLNWYWDYCFQNNNSSIKPQWNLVASYSENQWPTYKSSNLILEINPWNIVYPANGSVKMYYDWNVVTYIQDLSNIKIQNAWWYVLAYPEVYVWNKPWNWNYVDAGNKLPAKIDKFKSLQVEASWKYEHPADLSCNFAMEGWFTKNKFQKTWVGAWEVEMMIMWYRNIQGAAGSKVWTSTIPVKVNWINKNITFDIYKANIGWDFVTFIPQNYKDFQNASISFDILDFTKVAEKYVPQIKNLYLEDWEFWTEYGTPSTTTAQLAWQITKFKVTWKENDSDTSNDNQETWNTTTPSTLNYNFAPYVDTTLYPFPLLWDIAKQTNQYDYTLAFIISKNWKCEASWGGYYNIEKWPSAWINWKEKFLYDELSYLKSKNWKLFISFGGAAGIPLFKACSNKNDLVTQYKKVIDKIWTKYLDFDVEWAVLADKNAVNNLIYALKNLQSNYNNNLEIWFTLPVIPEWLTQDDLYLVNKAKSGWLKFAGVNLMTMDYGSSYNKDMWDYAIQAVENTKKQIWNIAIWITPMIGLNDITTENFTLEDTKQVYNYTKQNQNVKRVSYWSLNRDHFCSKTSVDLKCSSKNNQTKDWEYLYTFRWFSQNNWNLNNKTSTKTNIKNNRNSQKNSWNISNKYQKEILKYINKTNQTTNYNYNLWEEKIKKLTFNKLNINLGKYDKYYILFEKFFNLKKQQILNNSTYINKYYYNKLIWFNKDTNKLFQDIVNKNFNNIKLYLNRFKKTIKILKKIK